MANVSLSLTFVGKKCVDGCKLPRVFLPMDTVEVTGNGWTTVTSIKEPLGIRKSDSFNVLVHYYAHVSGVNYANRCVKSSLKLDVQHHKNLSYRCFTSRRKKCPDSSPGPTLECNLLVYKQFTSIPQTGDELKFNLLMFRVLKKVN